MISRHARSIVVLLLWLTAGGAYALGVGDPAPPIESPHWLNSPPLTAQDLDGKVVLVEFWTYGCWNCRNVEPHVQDWYRRYRDAGLVVIGVHTPEFERESRIENVAAYVRKNDVDNPVAIDNDFAIWNRYGNRFWPALYLRDRKGTLRYVHFGEGRYRETEAAIRALLAE
jgi:thiol-disulfide isomerase/thioredoxin